MKRVLITAVAVITAVALTSCTEGDGGSSDTKTLGIVALVATDALNAAVIEGATDAAERAGWEVVVTDTQGSPDRANAAMTDFSTTQPVDAILVCAFASSAIGAGLASARTANIPVVSWGGELVDGIVATTSAYQVGEDSVNAMLEDFGDTGEVLALTYHTGILCLHRGNAFEAGMEQNPGITVTSNEVAIPGQVEDGTAYTSAWLASHGEDDGPLAVWSCWDEPGLGAVAAQIQSGRTDVKNYSINGSPQALQAVQDGTLTQVIWQDGYTEGEELFTAAADSIEAGSDFEPITIDVPGVLVDESTIDQFLEDHPEALT